MSTAKGGVHSRAPKHQNAFAFKHNPNSKKTALIMSKTHTGLCKRCHEQVEWRKKYRKYKPLKAPKKCRGCGSKSITRAYHVLCKSCANNRKVCAKCTTLLPEMSEAKDDEKRNTMKVETPTEIKEYLVGLREREKRTIYRKIERGEVHMKKNDNGITLVIAGHDEDDEILDKKEDDYKMDEN